MQADRLGQRLHGVAAFDERRVRFEVVTLATLGLAILTNGPSIALSHHYSVPLGWERWPYLIPMVLVAYAGVFLASRSLQPSHLRRARWPLTFLMLYLAWALASVLWSAAADATAIRALVTAGVSMLGLWFGLSLSFREQLVSVSVAMSALCFWSLGLIWIQPHTHQIYPPPWHPGWHTTVFGVFGNPNSLGPVAALAALSGIGMWFAYPTLAVRAYSIASAIVGVVLVFWSQCITAIVGLLLAILTIVAALTLRWVRRVRWWIVSGSLVLAAIVAWNAAFGNIGRLAPLIGESTTLSSRRLIWADVRSAIALRPWRGYGFFAYWDNEQLTASTYQRIGSAYGSAHNSLLEVALGLGRVGVAFYLALAFVMIVGVARALWRVTSAETVAWAAFVLFLIVQNSMESFVLWHSYLWVLFVAATVIPTRLVSSTVMPAGQTTEDGGDDDGPTRPGGLRDSRVAHAEP